MPSNSQEKAVRKEPAADTTRINNTQVQVCSIPNSYACPWLWHIHTVRKRISRLVYSPFLLAVFHLYDWHRAVELQSLISDTALKLPVPQTRDWLLFKHMICSGSCTLIVASKQSELEASLLSTPQMLSKKTAATQLAQSSRCGMQ